MKTRQIFLIVAAMVAAGWAFRWQVVEVHPGGDSGHSGGAYLVNRWTGEVRFFSNGEVEIVVVP